MYRIRFTARNVGSAQFKKVKSEEPIVAVNSLEQLSSIMDTQNLFTKIGKKMDK